MGLPLQVDTPLHLNQELRFHLASEVHAYVQLLLDGEGGPRIRELADRLDDTGYHLRITRDLEAAKHYLRYRYADDPRARFGLIASSRDRELDKFGLPNSWQSTNRVQYGPWFADDEDDARGRSCRHLRTCVTEFGCQGLELDAVLLAWGTDFMREGGRWSNRLARAYQSEKRIRDPFRLRQNAYRVLMTRGRDATVVYVPALPKLDETFEYLADGGFRLLEPIHLA